MKRFQLSTLHSPLKNKGAALREILRFHAVGGETGQVSARREGVCVIQVCVRFLSHANVV
jgi:hypothetical protein